ncbi:MAG: zinc ribbon domain-containing protein [Methanobacteriaceae archaeon]|jgi:hypothetical protein|uniref:zinc-ribbon domain-containing protein n=1 Tax=unclassified Methanobrevibacter TaxID=2638681 RepID=UPI002A17E8C9|nr:zinc ribbon domain-containing protein [Methanobacteriaceae archaeon]MDD3408568.1 zinc ribbon domain-containing protein [Methanobacteriaceae archaeon]MDD4594028.1 zinc ribbon domain-containing protein [Methanobacteriaceae archaeon]
MVENHNICPKCGFKNSSDAKFCRKCGTNLIQSATPSFNQSNVTKITPDSKKDENKKYLIIGATIIILVVIVCCTFLLVSSSGTGSTFSSGLIPSSQSGSSSSNVQSSQSGSSSSNVQSSQSGSSSSTSGSWHLVQTFNGVGNDQLSVTGLTGSKIKVYAYGMPINNHGGYNHLYTNSYLNGASVGSTAVDWGTTSAVKGKEDSVIFSGSGSLSIDVDTQDLDSWTIKVYSYS